MIGLEAADGHRLEGYEALPEGRPRGAIVVVQEIFGVNSHIRGVADGYAANGYRVVAPALFDRVRKGIELGYTDADIAEGSSYYGGGIGQFAAEHPRCPTQCHFGEKDHAIPLTEVEAVRSANPDVAVFTYAAGHGFNCEQRASYDSTAAKLARERTLAFFHMHIV